MERTKTETLATVESHAYGNASFRDVVTEVAQHRLAERPVFAPTPLNRELTFESQLQLSLDLRKLTYGLPESAPRTTPKEVWSYIHESFFHRFYGRAAANEENFLTALATVDDNVFDKDVREMIRRGEAGTASPQELLLVRELLQIRSVELACLTHTYGEGIYPHLEEMRDYVKTAVQQMGGYLYDEPTERYRAKEFVLNMERQPDYTIGILMTRKRELGIMPDGTIIKERSSFVLRSDCLTDAEIAALETVDLDAEDWQDRMVQVGGLAEKIKVLLDEDDFELAIPMSTTIYAHNPKTEQLVRERLEQQKDQRREAFAEQYPHLAAAIRGVDLARGQKLVQLPGGDDEDDDEGGYDFDSFVSPNKKGREYGGLHYVGPDFSEEEIPTIIVPGADDPQGS